MQAASLVVEVLLPVEEGSLGPRQLLRQETEAEACLEGEAQLHPPAVPWPTQMMCYTLHPNRNHMFSGGFNRLFDDFWVVAWLRQLLSSIRLQKPSGEAVPADGLITAFWTYGCSGRIFKVRQAGPD